MVDLNRATSLEEGIDDLVIDMFTYHPWNHFQIEKGEKIRNVLLSAIRVIIANVPPGPDRTVAIRKIREARMDCNSAITHNGRY